MGSSRPTVLGRDKRGPPDAATVARRYPAYDRFTVLLIDPFISVYGLRLHQAIS